MKDRIIAFLKIGKKEFQKKIYQEGQFYMNTSEYFRQMAQEDSSGLVGDIHETSFPRDYAIKVSDIELNAFGEDDDCMAMTLGVDTCIFCFYAITLSMCKGNGSSVYFKIPSSTLKGIINSGNPEDYEVVLFLNPESLINRINERIISLNLYHKDGRVLYDNHYFDMDVQFLTEDMNSFAVELCFHKCKKFSNQQEYRIVIVNDSCEARNDIIIGALSSDEYEVFPIISIDEDMMIQWAKSNSNISFDSLV